jgi:hypothetical protein
MTMYKKTMREALQEVSSYKIKEEVELDEKKILVADPKTQEVIKIDEKDWPKYKKKGYVQAEETELDESVIDKVKKIASEKQAMKIDGVLVDMFTASAISQIYDKVNDANKKRMENLPITKLANLAFKMIQKK